MKYELNQIIAVAPTMGIDIEKGEVEIVAICNFRALPEYFDIEPWIEAFDPEQVGKILSAPWIGFTPIDMDFGEGVFYLPEYAFEEIT